jgi:ribonuclease J
MRACIRRGAAEIGGNTVELEAQGVRILLDLGRPLTAAVDEPVPLPPATADLAGVIISHPHEDHCGLLGDLPPDVPVYVGEAAGRILSEAAFFCGRRATPTPTGFLRDGVPITLGPFRVTPISVDHSAFDAYALIVEADGRTLLYTGDLRAHGRKGRLFERLLRVADSVDTLLMEGTAVRSDSGDVAMPAPTTERGVEAACIDTFRRTPGMVLAAYSPQNIDRLVSLYRAAVRSGRDLVMDLYAASMAAATGRRTIPQAAWDRVRVYLPRNQRRRIIHAGAFARTRAVHRRRIYADELAARADQLVMTFRFSMARELDAAGCLEGATCIWSMWSAYLEQPYGQELRRWLAARGIPVERHHASGHAPVADLQRLVSRLRPRRVVPMHTSAPERFPSLFPGVERRSDGEWWEV